MSGMMISSVDVDGKRGVRLTTKEGTLIRTLAVVADEQGAVTAAECLDEIDDTTLIRDHAVSDSGKYVPWIWSMLAGELDDNVLRQLNFRNQSEIPGLRERFAEAAGVRLSNVDQAAVSLLRSSAEPRLHLLAFYSGADEKAENRKRHGNIYPVFSDVMASGLRTKRVIDMKEGSLPEAVCKALSTTAHSVTPPYLKRFAQFKSFPEGCSRSAVVAFAVNVPPDWMPKTEADWVSFCQLATAVIDDLNPPADLLPAMIKATGGKWSDVVTKIMNAAYPPVPREAERPAPEGGQLLLEAPAGAAPQGADQALGVVPLENRRPEPFFGIRASLSDVRDMVSLFADNVVLPLAAFGHDSQNVFLSSEVRASAELTAFRLLFTNRNFQDIADLGRRFHQEHHTIMEGNEALQQERKRFIAQQVDGDWPGLSAKRQAPNGLWIVPETSLNSLKRVSAELDHCVGRGSYDVSAERCDCHIVSIKYVDPAGQLKCLSTIEFAGIKGPNGPFVSKQHRSHKNGAPPEAAEAAASWYVGSLKSGQIETNWEQIKIFKDVDLRNTDSIERACKYDWREPEYVFAATVPWHPFLAKSFRGMTFEELLQSPEITSIADGFAPDILRMQR